MPVESPVNYISDLNTTYPEHTDGLAQADSHIRLIKSALQTTFPNIKGAVSASQVDLANGYVPVGGIIIWSGLSTAIPTNWQICDGTNGTPDLRDKFVIGAGNAYTVGQTGGSTTVSGSTNADGTHTHQSTATSTSSSVSSSTSTATSASSSSQSLSMDNQGAHIHSGSSIANHSLVASEIPPHTHLINGGNTVNGSDPGIVYFQTLVPSGNLVVTGDGSTTSGLAGNGHNHGVTVTSDGGHTHSITGTITTTTTTTVSTTTGTTTTTSTSVTTPASSDSAHAHAFGVSNFLPPYYALCYIRRMT